MEEKKPASDWDGPHVLQPFVSSDAAFQSAFGSMQFTPLAEAVASFEAERSDAS
jgi:hypothetical protein